MSDESKRNLLSQSAQVNKIISYSIILSLSIIVGHNSDYKHGTYIQKIGKLIKKKNLK